MRKNLLSKLSLLRALGVVLSGIPSLLAVDASPNLPGQLISHMPASDAKYVGSPSIVKLPDGNLVASHDEFGDGSTYTTSGTTRVFRSTNDGLSWSQITTINGAFWSTLFYHNDALYLIGTSRRGGDIVIRRSEDGGETWTSPTSSTTGQITTSGQYHCAPVPIIAHNGRFWRAFERRLPETYVQWAENNCSGMLSIPEDADLLDASNWTISNPLASDGSWLDGEFVGWLEGNAVVDRDGNLVNVIRVHKFTYPEKAAILQLSEDGSVISFDPETGFTDLPGGAKKFTIRWDEESQLYWSIVNYVPEEYKYGEPSSTRNTSALFSSPDLREWTNKGTLMFHPDIVYHGFQYVDWQFDGDDLIAVYRTSYDDHAGGAHTHHDANYLSFLRVRNFRDFESGDLPGSWQHAYSKHGDITADADEDGDGFTNRHEYLAGSNPLRIGSTPAHMGDTARVAVASAYGVDLFQVTANGEWTFERQLTANDYQSLLYFDGYIYASGFDHIDRVDPSTGEAVTLVTRNEGDALAAGWTNAHSQEIKVGPDGMLYFSTAFQDYSGEGVFRLNADGSGFSKFIARNGPGWELYNARGLVWSGTHWYISARATGSSTNRPIYEFDQDGQYVRTLRSDLIAPQGLSMDGDSLRVASYQGNFTGLNIDTGELETLVSGNPDMNIMSSTEIFGEMYVVSFMDGIWRHHLFASLTLACMPDNDQLRSMVVIPEDDNFGPWTETYALGSESGEDDDPDGDGVPNRLEFLMNWDPTDGQSDFRAHVSGLDSNGLRLAWPSASDVVFTIRSSADMIDWSTIEAVSIGSPDQTEAEVSFQPESDSQRFYRVEWTQ